MRNNSIERLFYQDIREKKQAGRGIFSARGKRGYVGKLYLQYDLLRGKEKRAYAKAGKVKVSNMYDEILTREEFEALPQEDRTRRLRHWRLKYTVKNIQNEMGVASATLYRFIREAGLEGQHIPRGRHAKKKALTQPPAPKREAVQNITPQVNKEAKQEPKAKKEAPVQEILLNGLNLALNGEYTVEQIQSKFDRINLMLEDEKSKFRVELRLYELEEKERTE